MVKTFFLKNVIITIQLKVQQTNPIVFLKIPTSGLFYISILYIFSIPLAAQEFSIAKKTESIVIRKDSSFIRQISVTIKKSEELVPYPIFYDNELEKVDSIQVHFKKGKRYKLEKDVAILDEAVELDYIASKKIKSVLYPPGFETKITYSIECDELMYLSNLPLFSYADIDTLAYQIKVPKTFRLAHNVIYKDSLDYFSIDSTLTSNLEIWDIVALPEKTELDPLALFGIYKDKKEPIVRTIVSPSSYSTDAKKYLNNWYLEKLILKRGLNPVVAQKLDELTEGIYDQRKIVEIIYDYVKSNFKYVAVEIGMGAFIPTHANDVYTNKEGDCKDLSNFLSEALNYKGIKSHVALAATYDHISDCDFPSLSSANHVVCLAYLNDKPIILDPTDPIHIPDTPVQSIQNRTILVINGEGGQWLKVEGFTPEENTIDYELSLKEVPGQLSLHGNFNVEYNGISGNLLKRWYKNLAKDEVLDIGKRHYESVFGNQTISEIQVIQQAHRFSANGNLQVNGKVFNDVDNQLVFLDFLPRLFETENRATLLEGTHFGSNFNKKVKLKIELDKPFSKFSPIEHVLSKDGVSLSLKISCGDDKTLVCDYQFIVHYESVEAENINRINEMLKFFKKITNEPIILRRKT